MAELVPKLAFASESDVGITHNHCSGSEDSSSQVQELPVWRFIPTTLLQPQKKNGKEFEQALLLRLNLQ